MFIDQPDKYLFFSNVKKLMLINEMDNRGHLLLKNRSD